MVTAVAPDSGERMYQFIERLYPICRSITGEGVRQTLAIVGEHIPIERREIPSGTPVFDWTVPNEWNIRDAYVKNSRGERVIDFRRHNLHVVNYSVPVRVTMPLAELRKYLHSLPEHPDWIPYRTSYYRETWGFCLAHKDLERLEDGEYEVYIDSILAPGSLSYGEYRLPGESSEEVLLYTHVCHPSLCNDNLSGIALLTYLAMWLEGRSRRYSYRFVFAPGTIGAITWLSLNENVLGRIRHGLVVGLLGDRGGFTYKRSRRGDAEIDRIVSYALRVTGVVHEVVDFTPYGYDERQFCSPGINLPVGRLTRTPNGAYPEYHSSADNLDLVHPSSLQESLTLCATIVDLIEKNRTYVNTNPKCEPQLGKRGLYRQVGGIKDPGQREYALLWLLNQSDGTHSLFDIAERSGIEFMSLVAAAADLEACGLLLPVGSTVERR